MHLYLHLWLTNNTCLICRKIRDYKSYPSHRKFKLRATGMDFNNIRLRLKCSLMRTLMMLSGRKKILKSKVGLVRSSYSDSLTFTHVRTSLTLLNTLSIWAQMQNGFLTLKIIKFWGRIFQVSFLHQVALLNEIISWLGILLMTRIAQRDPSSSIQTSVKR